MKKEVLACQLGVLALCGALILAMCLSGGKPLRFPTIRHDGAPASVQIQKSYFTERNDYYDYH